MFQAEFIPLHTLCVDFELGLSAAFINDGFSVLTGVIRLNIIGAKLYKTSLAVGERKRGFFIQKKGSFFLFRNAKNLLASGEMRSNS